MKRNGKNITVLGLIILLSSSCTYYKNEIFIPPVSEEKPTLEAEHVKVPPSSITASYWTTADYLVVDVKDITTKQISPEDGLLNVNGMVNGVSDFNGGEASDLTLKAAYDDEYVYILATWKDKSLNVSGNNWLYNGPSDSLKSDSNSGWSSQGSTDNLIFSFSKSGTTRDVWKWNPAITGPMGYAIDMIDDGTNWTVDAGDKIYERNAVGDEFRSGPKYEWNGESQEITNELTGSVILDPAYFLLNKTEFTENINNGEKLFQGNCSFCHGSRGQGHAPFDTMAVSLRDPGKYARINLESLENTLSTDSTHDGSNYWNQLTDQGKKDVYARIKAFTGFPGYYLQTPSGSSSDVKAISNIQFSRVNIDGKNSGYKVLLIRKLSTGNDDDVQFNLSAGRQYSFDIFISDDDNLNLIGKKSEQLTFK